MENKYVNDGSLYEPYQGQTYDIDLQGNEMVEIPTGVKDELVIDKKGNVSLIKNVGKTIFDNNTSFTENTAWSEEAPNYFHAHTYIGERKNFSELIMDKFSKIKNYNLNKEGFFMDSTGRAIYLFISATKLTSFDVTGLKNWLSTHNTIVYYQLANQQTIPLGTLSELITTLNGTNNISINGNIPTTISTTYALDVKKYIDNKLAEISSALIEEG